MRTRPYHLAIGGHEKGASSGKPSEDLQSGTLVDEQHLSSLVSSGYRWFCQPLVSGGEDVHVSASWCSSRGQRTKNAVKPSTAMLRDATAGNGCDVKLRCYAAVDASLATSTRARPQGEGGLTDQGQAAVESCCRLSAPHPALLARLSPTRVPPSAPLPLCRAGQPALPTLSSRSRTPSHMAEPLHCQLPQAASTCSFPATRPLARRPPGSGAR